MAQRLVLIVPQGVAAEALADALLGGDVAACIMPAGPDLAALAAAAQEGGAAALVAVEVNGASAWPAPPPVDGVHLAGPFAARLDAVKRCPDGAMAGVVAGQRHEAMTLGEAGADYVMFGEPARLDPDALELAEWWQPLFEVPAVVAGPIGEVDQLAATGAEFVAVDVFGEAAPREAVAAVVRVLS